jgi:2-C-methyl-D-erythritol 4-phosphate cytidylyltransferase
MIEWSLDALRAAGIDHIVVALPEGVEAPAGCIGVRGGATRSESVQAALTAANDTGPTGPVLVHDAARPLVEPSLFTRCVQALRAADCAIAAARVTDTIKQAEGDTVVTTLDRSRLWAVQTPQVFRRAALQRALDQDHDAIGAATDDASLVEAAGGSIRVVEAPAENIKVTTPVDLEIAAALLRARS